MAMEVSIGDYGRMIFEMMTHKNHRPAHWESIAEEAEPLVRQLLALNEKMTNGGYEIVGHNQTLPQHERIQQAQIKLLGIHAKDVKPGEEVWTIDDDGLHQLLPFEGDPNAVMDHSHDGTVFFVTRPWGKNMYIKYGEDQIVIRKPEDYDESPEKYSSAEYWLNEAKKLGI